MVAKPVSAAAVAKREESVAASPGTKMRSPRGVPELGKHTTCPGSACLALEASLPLGGVSLMFRDVLLGSTKVHSGTLVTVVAGHSAIASSNIRNPRRDCIVSYSLTQYVILPTVLNREVSA